MNTITVAALLTTTLVISACGGSSSTGTTSSGTTGNTTSGTTTGNTTSGTSAGTTTTGTTTNGDTTAGNSSLLDAGLSHIGTAIETAALAANDSQILSTGQNRALALANPLGVIFEVVNNQGTSTGLNCTALGAQWNSCSIVNLHIKDAAGALDDNSWRLYFHSTRRILKVESNDFIAGNINGDLHYIAPNNSFTGFGGGVKSIKMITEYNHLVETDFQPRYWIARGSNTVLITNTDSETDETSYAEKITDNNRFEFVGETNKIANAAERYSVNADVTANVASLSAVQIQTRIIPRPTTISSTTGTLDISGGFSLDIAALPATSVQALQSRQAQFMGTGAGTALSASVDASLPTNSYTLDVNAAGITLAGSNQAMLFHAAQSLLALVQPGVGTIPHVSITDNPRFVYRGVHVDVARNFHSVASMQRLMDQMAAYKLNKLHIHMADDEGWRLEIPSLPELANVGGKRQYNVDGDGNVSELAGLMPAMGSGPNTNNQGSGFYTRNDFVGLLQYANARHIEVIPEFDMPAHARAAVVAMRARAYNLGNGTDINVRLDDPDDTSRYRTVQNYYDSFINPCVPGTYSFLTTLINDVQSMYTDAGLQLNVWHMGGDEAVNIFKGAGLTNFGFDASSYDFPWAKSPACESFITSTAGVNTRDDLSPYFVKRVSQIVADAGIPSFYAYQDIYDDIQASELATTNAGVGFWEPISSGGGIENANNFSNRGFQTIVSVPDFLYFDFPYEVDPEERGYYWATRQNPTRKVFSFAPENLPQNAETSVNRYGDAWSGTGQSSNQGFHGLQASLWSETVRTPEHFDYMLFPRLLALAERAWHKADWELDYVAGRSFNGSSSNVSKSQLDNDYAAFAAALGTKELRKLDAAGIRYRVPLPGASNTGGQLDMNIGLPGLSMQYSTDGNSWQNWSTTAKPAGAGFVRAVSADGTRFSRVAPVQ